MRSFKTIEFEKELKKPMKCPHCGQLLPQGKVICKHCQGQSGKEKIKNAKNTKEIECPNCKALNEKGNSIGGTQVLKELSEHLDLSLFQG